MVLGQRRLLGLQRCLTLSVQNRLLLLLLQGTNATESGHVLPNGLLRLLAQPGELLSRCLLGAKLLHPGLTIGAAEGLLRTGNLSCGSEGLLTCLHLRLLACLSQAKERLSQLRARPITLLRLLAKHPAKLLLSAQTLLCCLPHLLSQLLLSAKLLSSSRLKHLAVTLTCSQPLLCCSAGHPRKLLLCAKALSCGLTKLTGKLLLGAETLLGFGAKLASEGLGGTKALCASLAHALRLSGLSCKALSFCLPHG